MTRSSFFRERRESAQTEEPMAARRFFLADALPHFARPVGRLPERARSTALVACQLLIRNTKKKHFFSAVLPLCVLLPVWPCKGAVCPDDGSGALPLPADVGRIWAAVRAFVEDGSEALGPFPRDERKSRRKNRRFCGAGSLTTARGAGSCGILKGRCSGPETETMTPFSVEFGCCVRTAKSCRGAPGLWGREYPSQELRY